MKNKILTLLIFAGCLLMLAGCGCEHDFAPATCMVKQTCRLCGKRKGKLAEHVYVYNGCDKPLACINCLAESDEIAEHDYMPATCKAPSTCSKCGATQGETIDHDFYAANYQHGEVCKMCNKEKGTPLEAAFNKYELTCECEADTPYTYVTKAHENATEVEAQITFYDYERLTATPDPGNDIILTDAPRGYEWITVKAKIEAEGETAGEFGVDYMYVNEDYYDIFLHDGTLKSDLDHIFTFTADYNGHKYDKCISYVTTDDNWTIGEGGNTVLTYYIMVPTGYDGMVVGFVNASTVWDDIMHINDVVDDTSLLFRLN